MNKLTKEQAIIISAYTGILSCSFSDMHDDIEKRLGRGIQTLEFANENFLENIIRPLYREDFLALCPWE